MAKKTTQKLKKEARDEWQKQNYKDIIEKNKDVLMSIRDSGDAKDKDRVEACKILARMVGGLQAEKIKPSPQTKKEPQGEYQKLNQKDVNEIEKLLKES